MTTLSEHSASSMTGEGVVAFVEAIDSAQAVLRAIGDHALNDLGGGITTTQLRLLDRLERRGESRLIDLADALSIAPSTATRLCDTLAERQLIVRHRRGRDRRELQIRLTAAGTQLLEAVRRRTVSEWTQALTRISDQDRRYVARVLADVAAVEGSNGSSAEQARGLSA
ncbi:MAG TPA: MarR family winged helix-turn-helix transcriptional regulator [Acidimicrobiales bacterium]|jgi:DNA-binding MarR family transcriptional regulator|nr:MarR family winged helix-turn-helix transcriptional regulator [Acidimicrobiales bacterium]